MVLVVVVVFVLVVMSAVVVVFVDDVDVLVLVEVVGVDVLVLELVDVDVLVVVVSQPLHVLSHSPGTLAHNPWAKIVWHLNNDNLLRLPAQRCTVLVVLVEVVLVDVVVVVVSQPLHVLAQESEKEPHRSAANNS